MAATPDGARDGEFRCVECVTSAAVGAWLASIEMPELHATLVTRCGVTCLADVKRVTADQLAVSACGADERL